MDIIDLCAVVCYLHLKGSLMQVLLEMGATVGESAPTNSIMKKWDADFEHVRKKWLHDSWHIITHIITELQWTCMLLEL